jgi:hypothetical protein
VGILQGLFGYLRSSAKKVVQAIFGWAVQALFGNVAESEKTFLSIVVGAAAVWPVLLLGIAFPKITTFLVSFVPIPDWVSSNAVRIAWIGAALLVPGLVGLALARRAGGDLSAQPVWKRFAHGVPVTAGLGAAFLVALLTAPVRRLRAFSKRWRDEHVPLLTEAAQYESIAEEIRATLAGGGFDVRRGEAPWLLTAPSRVLRGLGGKIMHSRIPESLAFFRSEDLEAAVHPAGVTLQASGANLALAHGLISEKGTLSVGLQTTEPAAQKLERRLKDIWRVYARDPESHEKSAILTARLEDVVRELTEIPLDYEQWQVLYREILQVSRAIGGREQLIHRAKEVPMEERKGKEEPESWRARGPVPVRDMRSLSTGELVSGLLRETRTLIEHEVELAKAEMRENLKAQLALVKWFGVALVAALCFVETVFMTAALALSTVLSPWLAGALVAGFLLVVAIVATVVGWSRKEAPLETTRKTLKESWDWARNRVA